MIDKLDQLNSSAYKFNQDIASRVDTICQPLFSNFSFTNFGFVKIFQDKTMLRISSGPEWSHYYFLKQYYNDNDFYCFNNIPINGSVMKIFTNQPQGNVFTDLFNFNIWNICTIYERLIDCYHVWFFATDKDNFEPIHLYLNQKNILFSFIRYFKKNFDDIISCPSKEILITTSLKLQDDKKKEENKIHQFFLEIGEKNPMLKNILSEREKECLTYLFMGKSSKQIATILDVSPRTVEAHFSHIKQKTNCKKIIQLFKIFIDDGFNVDY